MYAKLCAVLRMQRYKETGKAHCVSLSRFWVYN